MTPLLSRSLGSEDPSIPLVTSPLTSTNTSSGPRNPSAFSSVNPASNTSSQPSPSESESRLLGIPSPSKSSVRVPSSVSRIPSLSSSRSFFFLLKSFVSLECVVPPSVKCYDVNFWTEEESFFSSSSEKTSKGLLSSYFFIVFTHRRRYTRCRRRPNRRRLNRNRLFDKLGLPSAKKTGTRRRIQTPV